MAGGLLWPAAFLLCTVLVMVRPVLRRSCDAARASRRAITLQEEAEADAESLLSAASG